MRTGVSGNSHAARVAVNTISLQIEALPADYGHCRGLLV